MQLARDLRQRILEERQQRTHIDVIGSRDFCSGDHVVRQIAHGRGAACGELRVGHQIDGYEIGERLRQRRLLAYVRDGLFDGGTQCAECVIGG